MFKSIRISARAFLLSVNLILATVAMAQKTVFPESSGDKCRYSAYIEIKKACVSGLCILANTDGVVAGSMFNEFGISMFDFTYDCSTDKVRIVSAAAKLDKWYIKRVLRKDISMLMKALRNGSGSYKDARHGLSFTLTPITTINNEENETAE